MLTKMIRKGMPFLGGILCLNGICSQALRMESVPASGPRASDGQITLFTDSERSLYEFQWEGPNEFEAHTAQIRDLAPGNYCVTVTDTNQNRQFLCKHLTFVCPDTPFGIQIKQPTPGNADGTLVLQSPKEETLLNFNWNTGDTSRTLCSLKEGYYHLTITNSVGCAYFPGIHLFEEKPKKEIFDNLVRKPPSIKTKNKVVHSGVRPATSFGAVRKLAITALYPNPFQEQLFVELNSPENSWISIVLHDSYHRHVFKNLRFANEGKNRFVLQYPEQLPQGLYIIGITNSNGFTKYEKLIHLPQPTLP